MRTLFYAYRRNSDGHVAFHGARPYCTKAAAKNGARVTFGLRTVYLTEAEQEAWAAKNGHLRVWRYRDKAEMDAILHQDFKLVTYEMRELPDEC